MQHTEDDGYALTIGDVQQLAESVISRVGDDFVYATKSSMVCAYRPLGRRVDKSDPRATHGCLVGSILTEAGYQRHADGLHDDMSIGDLNTYEVLGSDALNGDPKVVAYLTVLQNVQDSGSNHGYPLYDDQLTADAALRGWEARTWRQAKDIADRWLSEEQQTD